MKRLDIHVDLPDDRNVSIEWPDGAPLPHVHETFVWEGRTYEVAELVWEYRITGQVTTVLVSIFLQ